MYGEKVGGVSCFVQQAHKTLSEYYKRIFAIFGKIETVLQW